MKLRCCFEDTDINLFALVADIVVCVPLIDWIQIHFPKDTLICRAW